jgi:hypothetical protein
LARKPPEATQRQNQRIHRKASRKGTKSDPRSLRSAGFMMLLTSLPTDTSSQPTLQPLAPIANRPSAPAKRDIRSLAQTCKQNRKTSPQRAAATKTMPSRGRKKPYPITYVGLCPLALLT